MARAWWQWVWGTDRWLWVRLAVGVSLLAVLAGVDLARKGRRATRWKEYLFLLGVTAATMAYALVNDMITVSISRSYFLAHGNLPSDAPDVRSAAAVMALKGSWWVGLILGMAMLLANNPMRRWPRLGYRRMCSKVLYPLVAAAAASAVLGLAAWIGWFDALLGIAAHGRSWSGTAFERIYCVYGIHLGAYVGGALGGVAAVAAILLQRRRSAGSSPPGGSHIMGSHEEHRRL